MDRIFIRTKEDETLDIPLYDKVTVLTGDSATGKTKMLGWLSACKSVSKENPNEIVETSVNLEDITIITSEEMVKSLLKGEYYHKIIFIDRFMLWANTDLIEYIYNSENIYIILGHRNTSEITSQDAVLGLRHDGKNYTCYQIYENGLFNPKDII